jgi:hypothetical protein
VLKPSKDTPTSTELDTVVDEAGDVHSRAEPLSTRALTDSDPNTHSATDKLTKESPDTTTTSPPVLRPKRGVTDTTTTSSR